MIDGTTAILFAAALMLPIMNIVLWREVRSIALWIGLNVAWLAAVGTATARVFA